MRVIHVTEAYTGGVRRHILDLVEGLPDWESSLILSLGREPGRQGEIQRLRQHGTPVHVVPMRRRPSPTGDFRALIEITRRLRLIRPQILHCHSAKAGFLGRLAGRLAHVPASIYTPHALPFHPGMAAAGRETFRLLERLAGRWTTCLVAVSPSEARLAAEAGLLPPSAIRVIPNGVALPPRPRLPDEARRALGIPADRPVVLCVAYLRPQKAPLDWLRMAELVYQSQPETLFLWVGGGPLEREFLAAARVLLPLGSFHYYPSVVDVGLYYQAASVFTLASLWEGCPYALLDAMAWGLPCTATAVAGSSDAIRHGVNGMLCPPGNPAVMAEQVLWLIHDRGALSLGERARETIAEHYSLQQFLARHDALYRELSSLRGQQ